MASLNTISPLKRFFRLLQVDKQEIISIYIYALFNGLVTLSLPLGIQAIINLIGGGQVSTSWIVLVIFVILGIAFSGALQIMQLTVNENIQQKIFTRSAFEFAYRIPRMKTEALKDSYTPELVNRFFDTVSVQKGLSKILIDFSSASLQVLFGLILLSIYHPFFIIFSIVLISLAFILFKLTTPRGMRTSLKESKYKYEVLHWLEELGRTMETFKLSGGSPLPMEKTDQAVNNYLTSRKSHFKTLVIQYVNLVGFKVLIAAGLLIIGGLLVLNQQMNIGQFVASEIIIILVLGSVEKLILSMETIYDVLTAIEKVGHVTDVPLEKNDGVRLDDPDCKGISVEIQNLSYEIPGVQEPLLKDIDLTIHSGDKIVVAGLSNGGKSMLVEILAGLHNNFTGSISYNHIPFGNWCKEDLRFIIGDSLSKEDLFKGTLWENITLGMPGVTLERTHELTDIVGLHPFISGLPEGYNTELLPEGKNLPKSIRRKIMLARSISNAPKLILLDDNFNQLDEESRNNMTAYLKETEATVIIISNDEKLAKAFDKTMVMDKGEIVAFAPFSDMKLDQQFSKLFNK